MDKKISMPGDEDEKELNSIMENEKSEVTVRGRKMKIGWLKHETTRTITRILHKGGGGDGGGGDGGDGGDDKLGCKVAAAIVLNDYWKIHLLHWLTWRWYYYVRQYTEVELLPLVMEGKKKVPQEAYYALIMLSIGMRDTIMTMKKDEVERFLREQRGGQPTASGKNTRG